MLKEIKNETEAATTKEKKRLRRLRAVRKFRRKTNPQVIDQRERTMQTHVNRLRRVKYVVDTKEPKKFPHLLKNPKRDLQLQIEKEKIRQENEYLKEILHRAVQRGSLKRSSRESSRNLRIAFAAKKNAERRRIYEENQRLLARINKARREGGGVVEHSSSSSWRRRKHPITTSRQHPLISPIKSLSLSSETTTAISRWSSLTNDAIRSPTGVLLKRAIHSRPKTRRLRPLRLNHSGR